jgi:hypothetical protein
MLIASYSVALQGQVRGRLSTTTVSVDESVTLTISAVDAQGELDASALEQDFDITSRGTSREERYINGQHATIRSWAIELRPRKEGVYTIPAVKVGKLESQLLTLTVTAAPSGNKRRLFIEASVNVGDPYVQSQVMLTVRIYAAVNILNDSMSSPGGESLLTVPFNDEQVTREERDGRQYQVYTTRYALFPQKSGELTIDPILLEAMVPADANRVNSFLSPTRRLTRKTQAVTLHVKPRPDNIPGSWWMPASDVRLQSGWAGKPKEVRVDEPLTRTIELVALGVTQTQMPRITPPAVAGLGIYADEATSSMQGTSKGVRTEQQTRWAIIPQQAGTVTLPEVRVDWFDTDTGEAQVAIIPPETLTVLPRAASSAAATVGGSGNASDDAARGKSNGSLANTTVAADSQADELAAKDAEDEPPPADSVGDKLAESSESSESSTASDAQIDTASQAAESDVSGEQGPGTGGAGKQTDVVGAVQPGADRRWQWLSLFALGGWVLTVLYHLFTRRAQSALPSDQVHEKLTNSDALAATGGIKKIKSACASGSPADIAAAVLVWAARLWPDDSPRNLEAVARRLSHPHITARLQSLDASMYSRNDAGGIIDLSELAADLDAAAKSGRSPSRTSGAARTDQDTHLPAL